MSVAPEIQDMYPITELAFLPNASSTHATPPDACGYVDASSAVTSASGILHTKKKNKNPRMENKGPPARTVGSIPNGPPIFIKSIAILC